MTIAAIPNGLRSRDAPRFDAHGALCADVGDVCARVLCHVAHMPDKLVMRLMHARGTAGHWPDGRRACQRSVTSNSGSGSVSGSSTRGPLCAEAGQGQRVEIVTS
jgi:hypothetical protein